MHCGVQDVEKPKDEASSALKGSNSGLIGNSISSTSAAATTVKDAGYSNDAGYRCAEQDYSVCPSI